MQSVSGDGIDVESLGKRIRLVRTQRGRTLAQVAEASGLSTGFLSQVENGQTKVSLSALYRIAQALDASAPELLVAGAEPIVSVVRADENPWSRVDESEPPQLARMLTTTARRDIEAREATVPPGFRSDPPWSHPGEEFLYIIEGELSVELQSHGTEVLGVGDSMTFPASVPHRWVAGDASVRLLNIVANPSGPMARVIDGGGLVHDHR
jgi:transcriptional regulator with XRE-family HTH domain